MTTNNAAKLLRIRAADGGAVLLLTVEYDGGEGFVHDELHVFAARVGEIPAVGTLSDARLEQLLVEDAMYEAMTLGMRALSATDSSAAGLVHKLCAKGVAREIAVRSAEALADAGYLNEERGALFEVEKGLGKLWGDRRILAELRAKGYRDAALAAARGRLISEDGAARCRRLLQKKRISRPEDPKAVGKLIAALMRYGYGTGEIRAALQIELEDE